MRHNVIARPDASAAVAFVALTDGAEHDSPTPPRPTPSWTSPGSPSLSGRNDASLRPNETTTPPPRSSSSVAPGRTDPSARPGETAEASPTPAVTGSMTVENDRVVAVDGTLSSSRGGPPGALQTVETAAEHLGS
jgi:hypothetical protein